MKWDVPQYENQIESTFNMLKKGGSAIFLIYTENPEHQIRAFRLFDIPIMDTTNGENRIKGVHRMDLIYVPETFKNKECYFYQPRIRNDNIFKNVTPASIGLTTANAEYIVKKFLTMVNFNNPTPNELSEYLNVNLIKTFGKSFLATKKERANTEFTEEDVVRFEEILALPKEHQNDEFNTLSREMKNKWFGYCAFKEYNEIIDSLKSYTIIHAGNAEPHKKYKYSITTEQEEHVANIAKNFFRFNPAQVRSFNLNFQEGERIYGKLLSAISSDKPGQDKETGSQKNPASNVPF